MSNDTMMRDDFSNEITARSIAREARTLLPGNTAAIVKLSLLMGLVTAALSAALGLDEATGLRALVTELGVGAAGGLILAVILSRAGTISVARIPDSLMEFEIDLSRGLHTVLFFLVMELLIIAGVLISSLAFGPWMTALLTLFGAIALAPTLWLTPFAIIDGDLDGPDAVVYLESIMTGRRAQVIVTMAALQAISILLACTVIGFFWAIAFDVISKGILYRRLVKSAPRKHFAISPKIDIKNPMHYRRS